MSRPTHAKFLRDALTPFDAFRRSRGVSALGLGVIVALMGGCAGGGEKVADPGAKEEIRAESKEVFAPSWSMNAAAPPEPGGIREIGSVLDGMPFGTLGMAAPEKPATAPTPPAPIDPSASNWAIAIAVFRGEQHTEQAAQALARIRGEGGLPGAYLQRRGPSTLIAYGSYSGPEDPRAQADLRRVEDVRVDGIPVYEGAYLCPPYQSAAVAGMGEYDLRRAKAKYGSGALYTLQVGWYGREELPRPREEDLKEARRAAVEAAERLRREGELAFYYHGPNRSMVTVGVYGVADFDPMNNPGFESVRLREARRRHPLNLYNGAGYSYKSPGMRESKLLPSGLVAIPSK